MVVRTVWSTATLVTVQARRTKGHEVLGFIVAGLVIGMLARLLRFGTGGMGLLRTLLLGLVGSVIGGTIANLVGTGDIM